MITLRILVVDDQPVVLRSTTRLLESRGHEVVAVSTGDAARQVSGTFDVGVVDLELGADSGVELACALLEQGSVTRVVFFTAVVVGDPKLEEAARVGWVVPKGSRGVLQLVTAVEASQAPPAG